MLELPVIVVLAFLVIVVAYAAGMYWRRRQGVFPPPPPPGLNKRPTGLTAAPVSDREVRAVISWLLSQAFEQTGIRVADDRLAYQRIVEAAQKAVVELKNHDTFDARVRSRGFRPSHDRTRVNPSPRPTRVGVQAGRRELPHRSGDRRCWAPGSRSA